MKSVLVVRRIVAIALLGALAVATVNELVTVYPWRPAMHVLQLTFALTAAFAVATRRSWGRLLAIAGGLGGLTLHGWSALDSYLRSSSIDRSTWFMLCGSALLVLVLAGRQIGAHFGHAATVRGPRGGLLGAGVWLALGGATILLLFGVDLEATNPEWVLAQVLSLCTAALLVAGAVLVLRGRTVGALVILSGSFAAIQLATTQFHAWSLPAAVLVPAILAGPLVLAALAGPAWRRLRG